MPSELRFYDKMRELARIVNRHNGSPDAIVDLRDLLRDREVRRDFFRDLDRADWVVPLQNAGFFDDPPEIIRYEDSSVQYPTWPESTYLSRVASHAPSEVAAIFGRLETDNPTVIGDMLDATLAMPAEIAAKLVPMICRAAHDGTLWIHFSHASDLCVLLAGRDEVDAALTLADALFTPTLKEGQERTRGTDDYWYKDGLKKVVPVLAPRSPQVFLEKLCAWLKTAIEAENRVSKTGDDASCWWRPAIEEHSQNSDYELAGAIVGFVRDGFETVIEGGQLSLDEGLEIVGHYAYLVFKRLRLHLINEFSDKCVDLARSVILDRELFYDQRFKHEYAMLVGRRLSILTPGERATWFGWIDAGPDMSDFDESAAERLGRDVTDEDRQSRIDYWKFEKLYCVRDHLQDERREFYERMLAKDGEPRMADLNVRTEFGSGSQSPMTVEALAEMTFVEAVETVSAWKPEEQGFMAPDIEGLASTFEQYVATDPVPFSTEAGLLIDRPACYVRGFIDQMGKAVAAKRDLDVPAVLDLCKWVVERPIEERTTPEFERDILIDKNWQWTRNEISRFVEFICRATSDDAPKYSLDEYRDPMWSLLGSLCRDRSESVIADDVSQDDPRVRDYLDLGINSPRGKAVEAALEYARWVDNHLKKIDEGKQVIPGGFDAMPEIREMLEWQIAAENRSVEALSVIGSRLNLIYGIDKPWLKAKADQLFDLKGIERDPPVAQGWAAWNAFLVWGQAHIEFYRLFRSQFAYAVEQAATVQLTEQSRERPMNRLGEHLMFFYGGGQLGLDDDGGLLRGFLANSNPDIRRHAIGFIGRSLGSAKKVPEEVVERFMALWAIYWSGPGKHDAEEKPDSLLFGTWFSSGQLPEQWALEQLEQFVEVAPIVEPDDAVAKELAKMAQGDPLRSVRILDRMVRGDRDGWHIHSWSDEAKKILELAMKAGDEAREVSVELINYLGRRGCGDFGDLLK